MSATDSLSRDELCRVMRTFRNKNNEGIARIDKGQGKTAGVEDHRESAVTNRIGSDLFELKIMSKTQEVRQGALARPKHGPGCKPGVFSLSNCWRTKNLSRTALAAAAVPTLRLEI